MCRAMACSRRPLATPVSCTSVEDGAAFGAGRVLHDAGLVFKGVGHRAAQAKAEFREFRAAAREVAAGADIPQTYFRR